MITISDTDLENILKQLLQKNIELYLNERVWRSGRLLLFKQSGFFLEFIIRGEKKGRERFEVPIPFKIEADVEGVVLDYQLVSLVGKNTEAFNYVKLLKQQGRSKFYDTALRIKIIPDVIYEKPCEVRGPSSTS